MNVPFSPLAAALILLLAPASGAPIVQQGHLKASGASSDRFGFSVAMDGNTLVVGACNSGSAYVFERDGSGDWTQKSLLKASNAPADLFGYAVAVSGDMLVVTAPWENRASTGVNGDQNFGYAYHSGAAYVFVRNGNGDWIQEAYLKASNTDSDDLFGSSVAISGDTIVVGARGEDSNATGVNGDQQSKGGTLSGAAYVFTRDGESWNQEAYLKASNTDRGDRFGTAVAISGSTIVVGADREDSGASGVDGDQHDDTVDWAGAAYVFSRDGDGWSQQAYLKPGATDPHDEFGSSVAVSGDTVVVGAPRDDSGAAGVDGDPGNFDAADSGAAWVFARDGNEWSLLAYLKASNPEAHDAFGSSVAISGSAIVIGAIGEDSAARGIDGDQSDNNVAASGAAYVFERSSLKWAQRAYLKSGNPGTQDLFGWSATISGDIVAVGAQLEDVGDAKTVGAVHVFGPGTPPPAPARARAQSPRPFPVTRIGRRSRPQTLRITNVGGSPLTGLRVAASGRGRLDFRLVQPARRILAPGASTVFQASFTPRAAGLRRATLVVLGNAPSVKVPLSGRGRAKR